jgi:O-antigen ligase
MLKLFFVYVLAVPFMYHNWLGVIVGAGMILALILGLYLRSIMTGELFDRVLRLICALSLTSTGYAVLEAIINIMDDGVNKHRIAAVFSHPNYFGTITATVIIICAYKILTSQESRWFFYATAMMNVISLYLCKSMFAFGEVFIGIAVLLIMLKKHRLFMIWIAGAVIGAFLVFYIGIDLIPRLNDITLTLQIRQNIWRLAIDQIKRNPFFGHGFMSFSFLYDASFRSNMIPHSHSIYLDMLLNFGITGSVLFIWYFIRYYWAVIKATIRKGCVTTAALIMAVTAAALVHGATDLTLLWIQTLPLFLIILAGQGSEEKAEQFARGIEMI